MHNKSIFIWFLFSELHNKITGYGFEIDKGMLFIKVFKINVKKSCKIINIILFSKVNKEVATVVVKKILGQLTYLNAENICICLFDNDVTVEVKKSIAKRIMATKKTEARVVKPIPIPIVGK